MREAFAFLWVIVAGFSLIPLYAVLGAHDHKRVVQIIIIGWEVLWFVGCLILWIRG